MKKLHFEQIEAIIGPEYSAAKEIFKKEGWSGLSVRFQQLVMIGRAMNDPMDRIAAQAQALSFFTASQKVVVNDVLGGTGIFRRLLFPDSDYQHFATHANQFQILRHREGDLVTSTNTFEAYHVSCFDRAGRKIYEVTPGLADMLKQTDVRGLSLKDLRFPYESFLILVPETAGFEVWNDETEWHKLTHVYVSHDVEGTPACGSVRLMFVGDSKDPKNELDNAIFFFDVPLADRLIQEALDSKDWMKRKDERYVSVMNEVWPDVFRWVINVVLYITSDEASVAERVIDPEARALERRLTKARGTKKSNILAKLRTVNRRRHLILGEGISRATAAELGTTVRTRVRGHWHGYWTGEGVRSLSDEERAAARKDPERFRIKWIQPFWRGQGDESNPVVRLK